MNLWFQFVSYTSLEKYETELYTYLVLQHNHRQKISVEEFNRDIASILTIKKKYLCSTWIYYTWLVYFQHRTILLQQRNQLMV